MQCIVCTLEMPGTKFTYFCICGKNKIKIIAQTLQPVSAQIKASVEPWCDANIQVGYIRAGVILRPCVYITFSCFVTPNRKWIFFVSKASGPQKVFSNLDINTNVEVSQTFDSCRRLVSSGFLFLNFTWLTNWWRACLHCFFLNISFNITVLLPRWTQARKLHVLPHNQLCQQKHGNFTGASWKPRPPLPRFSARNPAFAAVKW